MSAGVIATVTWRMKPECADACVEMLRGMFPVTRQQKGFRSIRLLRGEENPDALILIQEWASSEDHRNYMQFRTETGEMATLMALTAASPQMNYWDVEPLADATI